ncbi:hypothetical protein CW304_31860 [Bacillus sp. UFRGS-B20]|nr:hypothetical protein CW304_31860 [Bacillus sp. UFRGS-B20]
MDGFSPRVAIMNGLLGKSGSNEGISTSFKNSYISLQRMFKILASLKHECSGQSFCYRNRAILFAFYLTLHKLISYLKDQTAIEFGPLYEPSFPN